MKQARGDGMRSVCIVCPSYLSSTPRAVKEADALSQAGLRVRLIAVHGSNVAQRAYDMELQRDKAWTCTFIPFSTAPEERGTWLRSGLVHRTAQTVPAILWRSTAIAERAEGRLFTQLKRAALAERADLYIGHMPAGLAAAAQAAAEHESHLGFDIEDFHTGQTQDQKSTARIEFLERKYIPRCSHLTAASEGIARAVAEKYSVRRPTVIHNVFEWREREDIDGSRIDRTSTDVLSLYWYSQTVGLDRGLQDAVKAIGLLNGPVELHVRGTASDDVKAALNNVAREAGVERMITFHDPVPPGELLSRASEHDVGLALEPGHNLNNSLASSNKMFMYLLAGLAVAGTNVPGQRAILEQVPGAALYEPGEPTALARILEAWRQDRQLLRRARSSALEAARERWNWELERQSLLDRVASLLGDPSLARLTNHERYKASHAT